MIDSAMRVTGEACDALWLGILHRICARAAHEVKGALNGVSVNLEVVRSRAAKPDALAVNVAKFATAASDQLEAVIAMTDALLALARPAREPAEIGRIVAQIGALLVPAARAESRTLAIDRSSGGESVTCAGGSAVRAAIGGCLLAAIEQSGDVRCGPWPSELEPRVRIESCDGVELTVPPELRSIISNTGIQILTESSVITISFPRVGAGITESA